jgi:hypothetical protein
MKKICEIVSCLKQENIEGFGSEMIIDAALELIKNLSQTKILSFVPYELQSKIKISWWNFILFSLKRTEDDIHEKASIALGELLLNPTAALLKENLERFLSQSTYSSNPANERGLLLALGYMPLEYIESRIYDIVEKLVCCQRKNGIHSNDAESRRNASKSLVKILNTIEPLFKSNKELIDKILLAFLEGMKDYSVDSRGDVGSWVRESSVCGLEIMCKMSKSTISLSDSSKLDIICLIIQGCLEKIDRVREKCGNVLLNLLNYDIDLPEKDFLSNIFAR